MPSEKLTRLLRSRGFSAEEIGAMSEADGWRSVYNQPKRARAAPLQICFSGFSVDEKATLAALASERGLDVVRSVTKRLSILCTGPDPGPSKLKCARDQGALILDRAEFERMLKTGEIPGAREAA